jgi:predicted ferric reductase
MPTNVSAQQEFEETLPVMELQSVIVLLLATIGGAFAAVVLLPSWLPGLSASLISDEPKAFWYLSRTSALVAYGLTWLSVALGLLVTNKLARVWPGGPMAVDVHQFASLLGLAFALFHVLILMGDRYTNYTFGQLFIPFASVNYRLQWVGLGQIAFYLIPPVAFSFYARKLIGYRAWRTLHYLSFVTFALVLTHALFSGTDSTMDFIRTMYGITGGSVLFLTVYRVVISKTKGISRTVPNNT